MTDLKHGLKELREESAYTRPVDHITDELKRIDLILQLAILKLQKMKKKGKMAENTY